MSESPLAFEGVCFARLDRLGVSQLWLCREDVGAEAAKFDLAAVPDMEPLPVRDFGDGHWTLTGGHCHAFVAWDYCALLHPLVYDFAIAGTPREAMVRAGVKWCRRFRLNSLPDLEHRLLPKAQFEKQWIQRRQATENLLFHADEALRAAWAAEYPDLFLYGASDDLRTLYFEDAQGHSFAVPAE